MKKTMLHDTSEMNVIFVHAALDDAGLTPRAFRLYGHIARRAGRGECWAAVGTMADHCGMDVKTARQAIRELLSRGMLARQARTGETTVYTLTPPSKWEPLPKNTPSQKTAGDPSQKTVGDPSQKTAGEVYPLKSIPEINPSNGDPEGFDLQVEAAENSPHALAEKIYAAYPRKVGKPAAIKAIRKALGALPFDTLLERVQNYAKSRQGQDANFTPHPATWFNQDRWNDLILTTTTTDDTDTKFW